MNKKFLKLAIKQAELAAKKGEVPVGAVVVIEGEVISEAHNMVEQLKDPTAHAEIIALKKAAEKIGDFRLRDAELYVTLEPCPMCAGAAINARVKEIIFGADDSVKGALGSVCNICSYPFPNRPIVFGGIEEAKCKKLLKDFFEEKRK